MLQEQLNFKGLILTDALNMKGVSNYLEPGDVELAAFKAGNDLLLFSENCENAISKIINAYNENEISEERLKYWKLDDSRLKIKHFPSREDYIKYIKKGHVFLSCARAEGWNLPLIEAMACGVPCVSFNCNYGPSDIIKDGVDGEGDGFVGFIHNVVIDNYLSKHEEPEDIELYFCGPPMMNNAVQKMGEDFGLDPDNIRFDDFGG